MARELRGTRYLTRENEPLKDAILTQLPYMDFYQTMRFYAAIEGSLDDKGRALLNANDRFYLLTITCKRRDAWKSWIFDRCREVERSPDGHLDLWARYHYKSTICTFGGCLQEIIIDPEITIAIIAGTNKIALPFLIQLQEEMESNEDLKRIHPDVFWDEPRKQAPQWSREKGITVRRRTNPKEATVEAFGLIDGMRTGKHYKLLNYDDLIDETMVDNPEMITKVTQRWELSDNLGQLSGTRKWHQGTRYCTIGSMRITMEDWSQKRIEDVRIGDTVIGWELRDGKRWLRKSKVVNRGIHFQQPVNRYTLDSGRSVVCTEDHKWWRGAHGSGAEYQPLALPRSREGRKNRICQPRGTTPRLRELLVPTERSDAREAAWLAGFFDGEGTIKKNPNHPSGTVCITQTMHNPGLVEETRRVLKKLGFEYSESWHSPANQEWADRCIFLINGGWRERYRFLKEVDPVRRDKLEATLFGQLTTEARELCSVEDAGLADVHWLETETGNYVVEGFCSSNSFADTYGILIERKALKERRHPATEDGTLKGKPVLLSPERWAEVKNAQRSTVNAQMLLNPIAGNEATFAVERLKHYDIIPAIMNVYIMVDPSKGKTKRSDRTALAVIGIDQAENKYLLDGYCHRMKLSRRYELLTQLKEKWEDHPGVQVLQIGYEQYGMQTDLEVIEEYQQRDENFYNIKEINTPREGKHSKKDRIERLEPDINGGRFFLPAVVYHPEYGGGLANQALWDVWTKADFDRMQDAGAADNKNIGDIVYRPMVNLTKSQRAMEATGQGYRIVRAIKRRNEDGDIYDLTRALMEELRFHPFAPHDDLSDAVSRIYDMEAKAPTPWETAKAEGPAHPDA